MNSRKHFLQAISAGEEIDIACCAMIIAGEFQPGLNIQEELGAIDQLVLEAYSFPVIDAHSLVKFLAFENRFIGNSDDYYSITNSLLNQVLTSRRGIPITLALVYLAVVQKLTSDSAYSDSQSLETHPLRAWGISFPGHFLVGVSDGKGEHLIDPFKGDIVTKQECYSIIANLYGRSHEPDDRYFEPADGKDILGRVLENLKAINLRTDQAESALVCLDYQLMLFPESTVLLQQQDALLKFLRDKNLAGESLLQ